MSISDKLTYLNETKQRIKESINLTNANITNEPFRQYAVILKNRLPEIVGDPSIIWNNYEHVTGSGTNISINAYNSIFKYNVLGNTSQASTTGKNLFYATDIVQNIVTSYTIYDNNNMQLVYTGSNSFRNIRFRITNIKPNTDYKFRAKFTCSNSAVTSLWCQVTGEQTNIQLYNSAYWTNTAVSFNSGENTSLLVRIYANGTQEVDNTATWNDIEIVEASKIDTPYEPYTGGVASPNPDYPQPINVVSGDNTININSNAYPISLGNIELCKIGTYQDYIYKDNGSWYLHKEIGKVVLDGSENWATSGSQPSNGLKVYLLRSDLGTINEFYNNLLIPITQSEYLNGTNQGLFIGNNNIFNVCLLNTNMTLAEWKTLLGNSNMITYYVLATPTNTEITDANLILQLNGVRLVNGLNNIITVGSDLNPILNIEAIKYLD